MLLPCLFRVRPLVLSKTLSQMWDRLNLPILLFKVGLLTLMYMDSLIFLAKVARNIKESMYLRQAGTLLPLGEEGRVSQAGSQAS